jgi:GAF domain-containing protein
VRETGAALAHALQDRTPFDCLAVYARTGIAIEALYMNGPSDCAFSSRPIPIGEGLSGWVAENARCIVNGNPTVDPNFVPGAGLFTVESSALAVPLIGANGVSFGALTLYARAAAAYSRDHRQLLEDLVAEFAPALERAMHADDAKCLEADSSPVLASAGAS